MKHLLVFFPRIQLTECAYSCKVFNSQLVSLAFGLLVLFSCAKASSSTCFVGLQEIKGVAVPSGHYTETDRISLKGDLLTLFFCKAIFQCFASSPDYIFGHTKLVQSSGAPS